MFGLDKKVSFDFCNYRMIFFLWNIENIRRGIVD